MSEDVKDAFVCPNCHSDQIQSYELIYAQNVSSSTHTTTRVGISTGGGLGSGVATTSGTSVTALGEAVAPPMMKGGMGKKKGCLFAFGVFILGSILGGIIGSVLGKSVGDFVVILALAGFIFYQYIQNPLNLNKHKHSFSFAYKIFSKISTVFLCISSVSWV